MAALSPLAARTLLVLAVVAGLVAAVCIRSLVTRTGLVLRLALFILPLGLMRGPRHRGRCWPAVAGFCSPRDMEVLYEL